jgi:hypothetical protein
MDKNFEKGIGLAVAGSLLASSVACAGSPMKKDPLASASSDLSKPPMTEMYYGDPILQEPSPTPTMGPQAVSYSPLRLEPTPTIAPTEITHEFDESVTEISSWKDYRLESVEDMKPGYTGILSQDTSLYMIPLKKDNFVDYKKDKDKEREVKEITVAKDTRFEIAQVRTLQGPNNESIRVGAVANTFGENAASILLLSATDKYGNTQQFVQESQEEDRTVSYVVSEEFIYPNKIVNTLLALENISEYQKENGPMVAGETQSYLDMIKLEDPAEMSKFSVGLTSSKAELKGAGVCAMATAISSLVHLSEKGDQEIIVEQWAHPVRYAQGPFSPSEYTVDATVGLNPVYDFRWIQEETKYLKIDISLSPSDIKYENTSMNGVGGISDANLIVTLSFTDVVPMNQDEYIHKFLEDYKAFRESGHADPLASQKQGTNVSRYSLNELSDTVDLLYYAEEIRYFGDLIEQDKTIQNIFELQDAVNSFPVDSDMRLDDYLQTTDWYRNFVNEENKDRVDKVLSLASNTRIDGQPLQCVGFVMIASWIYPDLNIPYVGGMPVASARELIPEGVRNYSYEGITSSSSGISYVVADGGEIPLEQYEPGNLFVRTDGAIVASTGKPSGHIGAVIAKTTDEYGNTVLLIADANRHNDGRIRIFEVDESNREEVFGYPNQYLLRYNSK